MTKIPCEPESSQQYRFAKLAILAGMRPAEIFALAWGEITPVYANIRQRVSRGVIDSPKTANSDRRAAVDWPKVGKGWTRLGRFPGEAPDSCEPHERFWRRAQAACLSAWTQPLRQPERLHAVGGFKTPKCRKLAGEFAEWSSNGVHGFNRFCKLLILWSGRPGSNRRHSAWEADVLPLNYSRPL